MKIVLCPINCPRKKLIVMPLLSCFDFIVGAACIDRFFASSDIKPKDQMRTSNQFIYILYGPVGSRKLFQSYWLQVRTPVWAICFYFVWPIGYDKRIQKPRALSSNPGIGYILTFYIRQLFITLCGPVDRTNGFRSHRLRI